MTDFDLAELERLGAAATPGPWYLREEIDGYRAGRLTVVSAMRPDTAQMSRIVTVDQTRQHIEPAEPNTALIAYVGTHWPAIVAALGRAQETERHGVIGIWQERPGEISWRCRCGLVHKHQPLSNYRTNRLVCADSALGGRDHNHRRRSMSLMIKPNGQHVVRCETVNEQGVQCRDEACHTWVPQVRRRHDFTGPEPTMTEVSS